MNNLCFGMKVINITQLPGGSFSHPNNAMDLAGSDNGIDFWFAQGDWKCIAGPWGNGTYFFVPVNSAGNTTAVHCADGVDRIVTIALTHSETKYVKTKVGAIYRNGTPMYEEGVKGKATGNHIHLEVAAGAQSTKTYDSAYKVYRMKNELNPLKVFYVNEAFSKVTNSKGAKLNYCNGVEFALNGWKKIGNNWCYYKNNVKLSGWQKLKWSKGTNWFFFSAQGNMLTGWQKLTWNNDVDWYYFDPTSGAMDASKTIDTKVKLNKSGKAVFM